MDDIRIPHFEAQGTIKDLIQAPGRTSPLAVIDFDGKKTYQLAVEGTAVGQTVEIGGNVVSPGNILALSNIPEGTLVHNVEGQPGDGGKFVKTAGTSALVVSRGKVVILSMPSGVLKEFNPNCRAVVGVVAGGGRVDKPLAKAGKNVLTMRSRSVTTRHTSGVAMNAVDHPHGGGSHPHVGGPNCHGRTAPPGQKAGFIAPKKKSKKRK
ncbi:LSU ribosomal protein L2P [Thermoplasmatales archaeon BRNA1]|nr:LSU ribosomal protein L2P [Thermoplasmatales archaeon BRNA1]